MASRTNASVPFMITAKMKYDLKTLGYTDEDIYKMKVDDAHEILNSGLRKGEVKKTYGKKKSSSSSLASYIPTIAALVLTLALVYFVFLPKVDDISAACRVLSESYCIVVSGPQQASAEVLPAPRSNARPSPVTGSMKHELKQLGYSNDEVSKMPPDIAHQILATKLRKRVLPMPTTVNPHHPPVAEDADESSQPEISPRAVVICVLLAIVVVTVQSSSSFS
ncbi:hypothetical protein LEN26_018291 [Aphanomyces euteiches]|nr:hypothetical protein LEN26_018291 [Aphanomyces euteiches]KAH9114995.1 hypothetical protein AeMF1_010914 [Aphanomyces euteiches]KAH9195888.1 hypothetical protein AeNC1_002156 [Aphanomyces euteiches]